MKNEIEKDYEVLEIEQFEDDFDLPQEEPL